MVWGGQQSPAPALLSPPSKMGLLQMRDPEKGLVPCPLTGRGEAPEMPLLPRIAQPRLLGLAMDPSWGGGRTCCGGWERSTKRAIERDPRATQQR